MLRIIYKLSKKRHSRVDLEKVVDVRDNANVIGEKVYMGTQ